MSPLFFAHLQLEGLGPSTRYLSGKPRASAKREALVELGLKESYKSCASEVSNATWVEWLYDVVWLDKNEIGLIGAIPLVGEIEWGNERAVWDGFQKLLAARAADRVMIFEEKGPELRSWLGRQIEGFVSSREGDRYLFASYVTVERCFSVEEYVVRC